MMVLSIQNMSLQLSNDSELALRKELLRLCVSLRVVSTANGGDVPTTTLQSLAYIQAVLESSTQPGSPWSLRVGLSQDSRGMALSLRIQPPTSPATSPKSSVARKKHEQLPLVAVDQSSHSCPEDRASVSLLSHQLSKL